VSIKIEAEADFKIEAEADFRKYGSVDRKKVEVEIKKKENEITVNKESANMTFNGTQLSFTTTTGEYCLSDDGTGSDLSIADMRKQLS